MLRSRRYLGVRLYMQVIAAAVAGAALALGSPLAEASSELTWYDEFRQQVAQEMVDNAIAAYSADAEGAFAAIGDTHNTIFHDGELYVFVLDGENVMVAHGADQDLMGIDFDNVDDIRGTNLGELFTANRSPYGKWVEYYRTNPATESGERELKLSWNKFHAGHTFGVGIYPGHDDAGIELTNADRERQRVAVAMTDRAIGAFVADRESAISAIQDDGQGRGLYHDGELYVFVLDGENVLVAHGADQDLLGTDFDDVNDTRDTNIGELFTANRSPYGKWVQYYWPNPATESGASELKLSWIKFHAGYTFGVGIYPGHDDADIELTDADRERQRVAVEMADRAIEAFGLDRASAISAIQDPDNLLYHDKELYVVIDGGNGLVAHGVDPELTGMDGNSIVDAAGNNLGEIFGSGASPYGRWIEHYRTNPATESDEEVPKYSWAKTAYGHTFIVGIYPGFAHESGVELSAADRERQRVAVAMADRAIDAFVADRESALSAIQDDQDNILYHDGELYVFVVDGNGTKIAHGINPDLVGTNQYTVSDIHGTNLGELYEANASPYGKWVKYYWPNPATESDESELKLSWIKFHAGYIFGVGIYPEQADSMMTMTTTSMSSP